MFDCMVEDYERLTFLQCLRNPEPYRIYAQLEMSLGNFGLARKILFRGAQAVSQSADGGLGSRIGLAELFHTWALCEWHLGNLPRSEVLFDHALRLTDAGEEGSRLRSFILYSIARLEYCRGEYHLAQHCVGLCLKENMMPGGNTEAWRLWAKISEKMGNSVLQGECTEQAGRTGKHEESEHVKLSQFLCNRGTSDGASINSRPWEFKLFGNAGLRRGSGFFTEAKFPAVDNC